jgi:hypothetical protein
MDIKITFDAPKGWARRALLYVATPLALVGVTAAIASAGPMNPIDTLWIAAPHQISAALLKANLDDLQTQCTANENQSNSLQSQATTLQTTVNTLTAAVTKLQAPTRMCGQTMGLDGNRGGYKGLATVCHGVGACSSKAHVCSLAEVEAALAAGEAQPNAGQVAILGGQPDDCSRWGSASPGFYTTAFDPADWGPTKLPCNAPLNFVCCEWP